MRRHDGELTVEEEQEARRKLMRRARNGDAAAQAELMESFGARIYSASERSKMPQYDREPEKQKRTGRLKRRRTSSTPKAASRPRSGGRRKGD